jgi:predicted transcriptional regulator
LKENGFLEQEKISQDGGGYRHVYTAVDPKVVAERMQRKLNDWYAEVGQLIHEFKEKYSE